MPQKIFIIAGERSGDLHGGNLAKALLAKNQTLQLCGWGGDYMQNNGVEVLKHYGETAVMGVLEVMWNINKILGNLKKCKQDIAAFEPDVVVLIDYGGFNMKIAKFCHSHGIKVSYYITPKVWAWNTSRALKLKEWCDQLLVILPFEVDFFKKYNTEALYVGNPIMDEIEAFEPNSNFREKYNLSQKPIIALLAGSRPMEVQQMLPDMIAVSKYYTDYQFVIAGVENIDKGLYSNILHNYNIPIIYNDTYNILHHAEAALVTSGTATLETALLSCPQVVLYKTNALQYAIGRKLVAINYISLVNLINNKPTVTELLQNKCTPNQIKTKLDLILNKGKNRQQQLTEYKELQAKVGKAGASNRAAEAIVSLL